MKRITAGGVNSNFRYRYPYPLYFSKAKGSKLWDVDGNEYIDCLVNYGACILGHAPPRIIEHVKTQLGESGLAVGLETELSLEVAEKLAKIVSADVVRFANSGTEAVMHAVRIARAYTGKDKIIKIEGAYNGWYDSVYMNGATRTHSKLIGPRNAIHTIPACDGLTKGTIQDTIVIPFNDEKIAHEAIERNQREVAALVMEPAIFNLGVVLPNKGYQQAIREMTQENGVLLIYDEVRTGFRLAPGGGAQYYGIKPDLMAYSKAISNGFPVSAVAGQEEVMQIIDPLTGRVSYSGTYNANQMSLAAATVVLDELATGRVQDHLNAASNKIVNGIERAARERNLPVKAYGLGGNWHVYFTDQEIVDYRSALSNDDNRSSTFQSEMLKQGIFMFQGGPFFCHGTSYAHNEEDLNRIVHCAEKALDKIAGKT